MNKLIAEKSRAISKVILDELKRKILCLNSRGESLRKNSLQNASQKNALKNSSQKEKYYQETISKYEYEIYKQLLLLKGIIV